ncbi:Helix-turn-helix [Rubrobacter radiotolerans DSM 5868]|nr:Helix-turn-helix [Rubrobacter radiotolerans DSM 5868]
MMTQGRLAETAGVSPTTVSGIESGRILRPHFGTVRKLAGALEVAPEELLLSGDGAQRPGAPLSLAWAREAHEEEFDRELEVASDEQLDTLARELEEERGRLQRLFAEFPPGEERRLIKRRIRTLSAHSGSVSAQVHSNEVRAGGSGRSSEEPSGA